MYLAYVILYFYQLNCNLRMNKLKMKSISSLFLFSIFFVTQSFTKSTYENNVEVSHHPVSNEQIASQDTSFMDQIIDNFSLPTVRDFFPNTDESEIVLYESIVTIVFGKKKYFVHFMKLTVIK